MEGLVDKWIEEWIDWFADKRMDGRNREGLVEITCSIMSNKMILWGQD